MDVVILGMLKKYIQETLVGMGALKGAPCTVQGVVDNGDGTQTLTLKWEDTEGGTHTSDIVLPSAIFDITSPTNGQTIRYNAVSGKWENSNVSFSANLDDLDDVVISSVQNGQVLTYDAANNRWINSDGSTVASLSDLTDVTVTTVQNGQVLTYNSATNKWVNVSLNIDDLGNISITSASDGQILTYNGTSGKWENKTLELDAADIDYDNTTSGLAATTAQGAIDELAEEKVDKVTGKGLSENDYTDADKAIVDGVTSALEGKVDKETGKGLSTNDFTTALKDKLDGIEAGAEVNDIDTVKVNGTALTPDANKAVNIELAMDKLSDVDLTDIADGMILIYDAANDKWYAGANTGASYTAGEGIEIDQNNVISSKMVLFTGTEAQWAALPLADKKKFTHYATNDDQTGQIDPVPTQNSSNLMTSGGIYTALQAKANTADLGTAAAKDSTNAITQSSTDLVESGAVYTALQDKADKVTGATANNFAGLDANGNLQDSGKKASDFATAEGLANEAATRSAMGAKNILPFDLADIKALNTNGTWAGNIYTYRGVDFTVNSDGTILADGQATGGNASIKVFAASSSYEMLGKNVILNGCPSGGGATSYRIQAYRMGSVDGSVGTYFDDGDGTIAFDALNNASGTVGSFAVAVYENYDADNLLFKPMVRLATDSDGTYQPYAKTNRELTEENQTLTNEVDTIVNELSAKNIFDIEKWLTSVGLAYTKNGDTYTTSTGGQSYGTPFVFADKDIDIVISGIITNDTSNNVRVEVLNVNNEVIATIKEDTTFASGKGCKVRLNWSVGGDFTIEKPMIRIATIEDSTYAPYAMTNRELTNGGYSILSATANTDIIDLDNLTFVKSVKVVNATGYFHTKVAAAKNDLLYTFDEKTKAGNVSYKPYVLAANNSGSTFLLRVDEKEIRIDENTGIPVGNYAIIGSIFVQ